MKYIITLLTLASLIACSKATQGPAGTPAVHPSRADGGVDVGNMRTSIVPNTGAQVTYPKDWNASEDAKELKLENSSGSRIKASRGTLDLVSPNGHSLVSHLNAKHKDRNYSLVTINGMQGARADLMKTATEVRADMYLVSEVGDLVHLVANLKITDDGIKIGEAILSSVMVEYKGVPVSDPNPHTVTLYNYNKNWGGPDHKKAAYSFANDCYSYVECRSSSGASVMYQNFDTNRGAPVFSVGIAGADTGRIIDLGPNVDFDEIKIQGKFLVVPGGTVPISNIYASFETNAPIKEQDRIQLKKSHVYLVRTISWPHEDMVTKMRVDAIDGDMKITIRYQKLAHVLRDDLQKQIDQMIEYTKKYEAPRNTGEVTLFNRSIWGNYFHASFNFEYSTSGNPYISHNSWDLMFDRGFRVPHTGGSLGDAVDLGSNIDIDSVDRSHFPNPNSYNPNSRGSSATLGHVYGIYHYDYEGELRLGAVKVLEIGPKEEWVRLKFRRISIEKAGHFQRWIPLKVPAGIQKVILTNANPNESIFYPFINKRGDAGSHYYERLWFEGYADRMLLSVDDRPFEKDKGLYKLGKNIPLESVTLQQIESLKGKFGRYYDIHEGDTVAFYLENYYDKTVMVARVDKVVPGKSVDLSIMYLDRAKTPFSDDVD